MVGVRKIYMKKHRKLLSLIVLVNFLWITLCPQGVFALQTPQQEETTSVSFSKDIGKVRDSWTGSSNKKIYLIEDAHSSSEAQYHIAEIISALTNQKNINQVYIEGLSGEVPIKDAFWFSDNRLTQVVSESFVDELLLSGPELAHVTGKQDFSLVGIENPKLYKQNLATFRKLLQTQIDPANTIQEIENKILRLKKKYYFEKALEFDQLLTRHNKGTVDPLEFFQELYTFTVHTKIKLDHFPYIQELFRYFEYNHREEIDADLLNAEHIYKELDFLIKKIKEVLFSTTVERVIDSASQRLDLIAKLISGNMTRHMWDRAEEQLRLFKEENIWVTINQLLSEDRPQTLVPLDSWIELALDFYDGAIQRDESFVKNTLSQLEKDKEAILVVGGFHTSGVAEILRRESISYDIIIPKINQVKRQEEAVYRELISGERAIVPSSFEINRLLTSLKTIPQEGISSLGTANQELVVTTRALIEIELLPTVFSLGTKQEVENRLLMALGSSLGVVDEDDSISIDTQIDLKAITSMQDIPISSIKKGLLEYGKWNGENRLHTNKAGVLFFNILNIGDLDERLRQFELAAIFALDYLHQNKLPPVILKRILYDFLNSETGARRIDKSIIVELLLNTALRIEEEETTVAVLHKKRIIGFLTGLIKTFDIGLHVHVTAEAKPFSNGGGQATVLKELPEVQAQYGIEQVVIVPAYIEEKSTLITKIKIDEVTGERTEKKVPAYQHRNLEETIAEFGFIQVGEVEFYMDSEKVVAQVLYKEENGIRYFSPYHPVYTDLLYRDHTESRHIEFKKSVFLAKASLEIMKVLNLSPDIITSHDWWAGLVPFLAKRHPRYVDDPNLSKAKHIYTIHNLKYQGTFGFREDVEEFGHKRSIDFFRFLNLDGEHAAWMRDVFRPFPNEFGEGAWDAGKVYERVVDEDTGIVFNRSRMSNTRAAIQDADEVVFVSQGYLKESLKPEKGEGLHQLLTVHFDKITSIGNGIKYRERMQKYYGMGLDLAESLRGKSANELEGWEIEARNKINDLHRYNGSKFDPENYRELLLYIKRLAKRKVQRDYGLKQERGIPLISFMGRLTTQKGIEVMSHWFDQLLQDWEDGEPLQLTDESGQKRPFQLVLGGPPDEADHFFSEFDYRAKMLAEAYPDSVVYLPSFIPVDEFFLASNFFLMPSKWEPAGLMQIEAIPAGAVIIARKTGGLISTVIQWVSREINEVKQGRGYGFLFENFSLKAMTDTITQALKSYPYGDADKADRVWTKLVENAVRAEHSWDRAMNRGYLPLYKGVNVLALKDYVPIPEVLASSLGTNLMEEIEWGVNDAEEGAQAVKESKETFTVIYHLKDAMTEPEFESLIQSALAVVANPKARVQLVTSDLGKKSFLNRKKNLLIKNPEFNNRINIQYNSLRKKQDYQKLQAGSRGNIILVTDYEVAQLVKSNSEEAEMIFMASDVLDEGSYEQLDGNSSWLQQNRDGLLLGLAADLLLKQAPEAQSQKYLEISGIYVPRSNFLANDIAPIWLKEFRHNLLFSSQA